MNISYNKINNKTSQNDTQKSIDRREKTQLNVPNRTGTGKSYFDACSCSFFSITPINIKWYAMDYLEKNPFRVIHIVLLHW